MDFGFVFSIRSDRTQSFAGVTLIIFNVSTFTSVEELEVTQGIRSEEWSKTCVN